RGDRAGGDDDLPDGAVLRVGDVEVAGAVGGDGVRVVERGGREGDVRAARPDRRARQRGDGGGRDGDLADGCVGGGGDVQVCRPVGGDARRRVETGGGARSVGAAGLARRACQRGHGAGGDDDLADGVVDAVGDVQVARAVGGDADRPVETGGR